MKQLTLSILLSLASAVALAQATPATPATPATSVSDWPTPTVSINTRSNSARMTTMAATVWSASPPSRSRQPWPRGG